MDWGKTGGHLDDLNREKNEKREMMRMEQGKERKGWGFKRVKRGSGY